ncbi:glycoside hydrolase family 2 protein [Salibacterium aidingense]|uniref:glycoside hydrolase family 2 protein n=1 Tax=Salibacterium aidingense TaxID=384933 RepID=UPI00041DFEBA|nr:glycoside hydrolase family 2 [Salibacterium aidingense]
MKEENTLPRKEYPRPQFKRDSWLNLNGTWSFAFDDENVGESSQWMKKKRFSKEILVPFTYETEASGIGDTEFHPYVWYQRPFQIPAEEASKKTILWFQASDYLTKVWVDGLYIGEHKGGNSAFSFDISKALTNESDHVLTVKVEDSLRCTQPRGKQRWRDENFGCWYVQTTGIWQTVWLEFVNEASIQHVKMTPDIDTNSVSFDYTLSSPVNKDYTVKTTIMYQGQPLKQYSFTPDRRTMSINIDMYSDINEWKVLYWTPAKPHLYDVTFSLYRNDQVVDQVESYFGMRKVSIKDGQVLLNNRPLYQKLLLDQGYWKDTMLTPPSEEAVLEDIEKTIDMGFNGVRKHQKLEDERFLYWCDKKGLLVWSEMAAAYEYTDEAVATFTEEWLAVMRQHYNHPSIITWVPFNESWGVPAIFQDKKQQAFTESIYYLSKALDSTRPVIVNDGWEHTVSDIITLHDYEEAGSAFFQRYREKQPIIANEIPHNKGKYALAKGYEYKGQPIIISEYGGIAFNEGKGWGYGHQVDTEDEFLARYKEITEAIKAIPYIVGYCYTQTTDVQQEINGLLREDRTPKVPLQKIKEINDAGAN